MSGLDTSENEFLPCVFLEEISVDMKRLLPILLLVFSVGVGAETIEYEGGAYAGKLVDGVPHS